MTLKGGAGGGMGARGGGAKMSQERI